MTRRISIIRVAVCGVLLAALYLSPKANADTVTFNFTTNFSGTPPPSTTSPWMQMEFEDIAPGTVRLTIANLSLTAGEFISNLYFNFDPADSPGSLLFLNPTSSGGFDMPLIFKGVNSEKADGDGFYDFRLGFKTTGNASKRFGPNEWLSYDLTGPAGLSVYDFLFQSSPGGGAGSFYAAAHMQGLSGGGSRWIAPCEPIITVIPEPAPLVLFGLGIGLLLVEHSTRRKLRRS